MFNFFPVLTSNRIKAEEDEKNLLYVAMTRAKKYLAINSSVLNLMCTIHHNFESVKVSNKSEELGTVCVDCHDTRDDDKNLFHFERKSKFMEGLLHFGSECRINSIVPAPWGT